MKEGHAGLLSHCKDFGEYGGMHLEGWSRAMPWYDIFERSSMAAVLCVDIMGWKKWWQQAIWFYCRNPGESFGGSRSGWQQEKKWVGFWIDFTSIIPFCSLSNFLVGHPLLFLLVLLGIIIHIWDLLKSTINWYLKRFHSRCSLSSPALFPYLYFNFTHILTLSQHWDSSHQCYFLYTHKSPFSIALFSCRIFSLLSSELPLIFLLFKSAGKAAFRFCFCINSFACYFGRCFQKM